MDITWLIWTSAPETIVKNKSIKKCFSPLGFIAVGYVFIEQINCRFATCLWHVGQHLKVGTAMLMVLILKTGHLGRNQAIRHLFIALIWIL